MRIKFEDLPEQYQRQLRDKITNNKKLKNNDISFNHVKNNGYTTCIIKGIKPIGKPRMSRSDKWKKRDCVVRYRCFADEIRKCFSSANLKEVEYLSWVVYFSMPKSWSNNKKEKMKGAPHKNKPDRDNIDKAILDSLFKNDNVIYKGCLTKLWDDGLGERIIITYK